MGGYTSVQVRTCEYVCKTDRMADTQTTPEVDLWLDSHQQDACIGGGRGRGEVDGGRSKRCATRGG